MENAENKLQFLKEVQLTTFKHYVEQFTSRDIVFYNESKDFKIFNSLDQPICCILIACYMGKHCKKFLKNKKEIVSKFSNVICYPSSILNYLRANPVDNISLIWSKEKIFNKNIIFNDIMSFVYENKLLSDRVVFLSNLNFINYVVNDEVIKFTYTLKGMKNNYKGYFKLDKIDNQTKFIYAYYKKDNLVTDVVELFINLSNQNDQLKDQVEKLTDKADYLKRKNREFSDEIINLRLRKRQKLEDNSSGSSV